MHEPSVFLSYSHADRNVARRLVRELGPHGIRVWIDESELRLGAVLSSTLRDRIEAADVLVVVASAASAASRWVALEVAHAHQHGTSIVPVYIEPVDTDPLFHDHLGIDATSRTRFAAAVRALISGLLGSAGRAVAEPDPAILEAGLRTLAAEEPGLAPLIEGHLDGAGLGHEQTSPFEAEFHALDHAVSALVELRRDEMAAHTAAVVFARAGAGAAALARWIELSGDGGVPLVMMAGRPLAPDLLDEAMALLRAADPPNNQALYEFIHVNSAQLDPAQRRTARTLVTWPRRGPERFGDVLGGVALRHFPGSPELERMWEHWITRGAFDGDPRSTHDLARQFALAEENGVPGMDRLHEALRLHVRSLLRSGDEQQVVRAVDHLTANVDEHTAAVPALLREASGVSGTSEWERWRERDRTAADRMGHYVGAHVDEAETSGDWAAAFAAFQTVQRVDEMRRQARRGHPEPPGGAP